jgi:beta-lactam-binding protein with PASTA domain
MTGAVEGHDAEGHVRVHASKTELTLGPGQSTTVGLDVRPRRPLLIGAPVLHRVTVEVRTGGAADGPPLTSETLFTQRPWLPRWAPRAAAVGAVVGLLALALPVKNFWERRPRAVPDVVAKGADDARQRLAEAGFAVEEKKAPSARPPGDVFEQNPAGNREAPGKSVVVISVSQGAKQEEVPILRGQPIDAARRLAREKGFDLREERVAHDTARVDEVVKQQPQPGELNPVDRPIRVEISNGPAPVKVPPVSGTFATAAQALQALGLQAVIAPADADANAVVNGTDPVAGSEVARNSTVTVFVRPAPTTTQAPPLGPPG